jgi:hypothetical protein
MFHVSGVEFDAVLGSGLVRKFMSSNKALKRTAKIGLLVFSIAILVAYAFALFFADNWNKMGIIISVSVVAMDLFTLVLYGSKMVENTSTLVVLLIINRIAMVVLGERYWIYGFMGLYMMYGVALFYLVARHNFPLASEVVVKHQSLKKVMAQARADGVVDRKEAMQLL